MGVMFEKCSFLMVERQNPYRKKKKNMLLQL